MKNISLYIYVLAVILLQGACAFAQTRYDGKVELDRNVHNFGDVLISDGPLECTFKIKNIGNDPFYIQNILTSCGCTKAQWTKETFKPGMSGEIKVTYSNDQGPGIFDKTATVYLSNRAQPIILYTRGNVMETRKPVEELYKEKFCSLGMKKASVKANNMEQRQQKSGETAIANLGSSPANVTFSNVSSGLKVSVEPNPVPAKGTARLVYTITAGSDRWGEVKYSATPVINGKSCSRKIDFTTTIKENFSDWTEQQREDCAMLELVSSTYDFSNVKAGTTVKAAFTIGNYGKSDLYIRAAYSETEGLKIGQLPVVKPGDRAVIKVEYNTTGLPKGETAAVISLITNSPLRPIVNLHIVGFIK